jgi:hypothetical protein
VAKSIKEQNRWQIWLIVVANSLFLYAIVRANSIEAKGLWAMFKDTNNLLSVGFALIVSTVLNGLLSADTKARLVFLRWQNALPGHRAFTQYGKTDPRIDLAKLAKLHGSALPTDPSEQNKLWYQFYKTVDNNPAVLHVHRDFLLTRDYTGLTSLFIVFYGGAGLYAIPSLRISVFYLLLLIIQYAIVRQAAAAYGVRMVTTVLASKGGPNEEIDSR